MMDNAILAITIKLTILKPIPVIVLKVNTGTKRQIMIVLTVLKVVLTVLAVINMTVLIAYHIMPFTMILLFNNQQLKNSVIHIHAGQNINI